MRNIQLALIFSVLSLHSFSQNSPNNERVNKEVLALKKKINVQNLRAKDLSTITQIRDEYLNIDLDSALRFSELEISLLKKAEDPDKIAVSRIVRAEILRKLNKIDLAQNILLKNVANKDKITDSTYANSLFTLAESEISLRSPSESVAHAIEAMNLYKKLKDFGKISKCQSHIACVYTFVLGEPEKGIEYFNDALSNIQDTDGYLIIRMYINYSSALLELKKHEDALTILRKAEKISEIPENIMLLPCVYAQFAHIYHDIGETEKSLKFSLLTEKRIEEIPNFFDLRTKEKAYWYSAQNYKLLKKYPEAIRYLKKVEGSNSVDPSKIQQFFIEIYQATGDYKRAFFIQEDLIDEINNTHRMERIEKLKELTEKYENEKKQKEIVTLNADKKLQENRIRMQQLMLYGIIGFFIILSIVGIFLYRTRMNLKETKLNLKTTQLQQRFLRTQLNPHFLFHALTTIEGYIYNNDAIRSAGFLRNFSMLMRNILEFSEFDFIPLRKDIDFIQKYMELQQLSHENKFSYEIKVSPDLVTEEIDIPPMLIQPAVENAILHGALNAEDGKVWIEFSKINEKVQIEIRDNGKRSNPNQNTTGKLNKSMSLDITQTRIKNLREVHGIQIDYTPFDAQDSGESYVRFILPL